MKRVYILDPATLKIDGFAYDEPGQVPPIVTPPKKEEPKDGGVAKEEPVPVGKPGEKKPA